MSNPLPEKEAPVNLRVSKALSLQREQVQAPGDVSAGELTPAPTPQMDARPAVTDAVEGHLLATPAFAAAAVALLIGTGWVMRRRQRLGRRPHRHAELATARVAPSPAPGELLADAPADVTATAAADATPIADVMADLALHFEEEPQSLHPRQTFPAQLEQQHRAPSRMRIASQKRLIKALMWVRTVAGGAAVVAAIALVVFWSIEMIDRRAGDTGLIQPLLVVVLAAWAASWSSGRLANQLHRMFFGRVHPKFDN